jgi:hypothetical protein
VCERTECKVKSVNFRRESDLRRPFRPAFRVTGICDDWYSSTMGVVVKCLEGPGTVSQSMGKSHTNTERCLGSWGYSFKELQALSDIFQMYTNNKNTIHV